MNLLLLPVRSCARQRGKELGLRRGLWHGMAWKVDSSVRSITRRAGSLRRKSDEWRPNFLPCLTNLLPIWKAQREKKKKNQTLEGIVSARGGRDPRPFLCITFQVYCCNVARLSPSFVFLSFLISTARRGAFALLCFALGYTHTHTHTHTKLSLRGAYLCAIRLSACHLYI